jgi:hypothetical protein
MGSTYTGVDVTSPVGNLRPKNTPCSTVALYAFICRRFRPFHAAPSGSATIPLQTKPSLRNTRLDAFSSGAVCAVTRTFGKSSVRGRRLLLCCYLCVGQSTRSRHRTTSGLGKNTRGVSYMEIRLIRIGTHCEAIRASKNRRFTRLKVKRDVIAVSLTNDLIVAADRRLESLAFYEADADSSGSPTR